MRAAIVAWGHQRGQRATQGSPIAGLLEALDRVVGDYVPTGDSPLAFGLAHRLSEAAHGMIDAFDTADEVADTGTTIAGIALRRVLSELDNSIREAESPRDSYAFGDVVWHLTEGGKGIVVDVSEVCVSVYFEHGGGVSLFAPEDAAKLLVSDEPIAPE